MHTTLKHYIENPAIEGSTSSQSEAIRKDLKQRFSDLMVREGGKIYYALYRNSRGDYFIHAKIPDESNLGIVFDVVLQFIETKELADPSVRSLSNYEVKFFSNDPGFMFTYTYAFNKHDLLIKDLRNKLSHRALTEPAKIKNPRNSIGVIKNFFFIYELMVLYKLFNKSTWLQAAKIGGANSISKIMSAEDKFAELQKASNEKKASKQISTSQTNTSNKRTILDKIKSAVKIAPSAPIVKKTVPKVKVAKRAKYVGKKK